jgi:hypothetical protein
LAIPGEFGGRQRSTLGPHGQGNIISVRELDIEERRLDSPNTGSRSGQNAAIYSSECIFGDRGSARRGGKINGGVSGCGAAAVGDCGSGQAGGCLEVA